MAKQPLANQPVSGFADHSGQKQLILILVLGLSLLALLGLGLSQLPAAHGQSANGPLNFGNQLVNTISGPQTATFINSTGFSATVSAGLQNGTDFNTTGNTCTGIIANGGQCSVNVVFSPKTPGLKNDSVKFNYTYNDFSDSAIVPGAKPNALVIGSSSTNLQGNGVNPHSPTTTTSIAPPCGSQIQGYVLVDGQPGAGQVVKLEGPSNDQATIGAGGFFYFNNLCAGTFKLSLVYDHSKFTAGTPDSLTIKTDGVNAYRDNAFSLATIRATTAAPTTAVVTTAAPTTAATATTPAVTTPPATPQCPASLFSPPTGTKLRIGGQVVKVSDTRSLLCVQVSAGDVLVDLNDTVIINLPAGAIVSQSSANLGTVTTSNTTVRWGAFSLNPKQSANLVLSIDSPGGNLNGSSIFVSGSFNRSQAFQQRIPGLPGLIDIAPAAPPPAQGGGTGPAAPPVIPSAAPATGVGAENNSGSPVFILILAVIASASLGILGLFLTGRANKRPNKKEQK